MSFRLMLFYNDIHVKLVISQDFVAAHLPGVQVFVPVTVSHGVPQDGAAHEVIKEPEQHKTNKRTCASNEVSDHPGHLPSLIRVFVVRLKKHWVLGYP